MNENENNEQVKEKTKKQRRLDISELDEHVHEIIDNALDESAEELGLTEEQASQSPSINTAQILTALFGLAVIFFAVFGIITAVGQMRDFAEAKKANAERRQYFERLVLPLCAIDAPTFDDVTALNSDVVISCACWDVILSPSASYAAENGYYTISYLDIDTRINKLFGNGVTYTHSTVGDEELMFEYNSGTGMYRIPVAPRALAYYPAVDSVEETENGYKLTVSYRIPVANWVSTGFSPDKIMVFNVVGKGLTYNISSLQVGEIVNTQGL